MKSDSDLIWEAVLNPIEITFYQTLPSQNALDSQIRLSQVFFFPCTTCIISKVSTFIKGHDQRLSAHSWPRRPRRGIGWLARTACLNKITLKNVWHSFSHTPAISRKTKTKTKVIIYHVKTDENSLCGVDSVHYLSHISVSYWSGDSAHMCVEHKCGAVLLLSYYFITAQTPESLWCKFRLVLDDTYIYADELTRDVPM